MARKQRRFQLAPQERGAIEAAIEFANCKVESVEQVEQIFQRAGLPRHVWQTVPAESVTDFRDHDQRELRRWLTQIVTRGHVIPEVRKEVAKRVQDTVQVLNARVIFEGAGRQGTTLRLQYDLSFSGVQSIYSYAVARLVSGDSDRLAKRLGLCERCGKFFFDSRAGAGARRKFCSDAERNRFYVWQHANPHKRWRRPELP